MTFETQEFTYAPSHHVPFRDKAVLERMRDIGREDFVNHPNPNLAVHVGEDFDMALDIFFRIKEASEADEHGNIAPESWPYGFTHALKKYFCSKLDPALRPPENQMIARLALFGPVTPRVPDSIIQLKPSEAYVSEAIAAKIEVDWNKGY